MVRFKHVLTLASIPILLCLSQQDLLAASLAEQLQAISVTIRAVPADASGGAEGSGVLISRKIEGVDTTFVWTAGHVVDGLRHTREAYDPSKGMRTIVEFDDARIIQELVENGRRVGESQYDAKVVKFSDSEHGEDLALLMVRKRGLAGEGAKFVLADEPVAMGTSLYHVGSLLGQFGANSLTSGILSQVGRVYLGHVYDQTTVAAFPGSSGGGVFVNDASSPDHGKYVGMLVRGAGETFNLIVPVRRMHSWARKSGIEWAIDPSVKTPTLDELNAISPDSDASGPGKKEVNHADSSEFHFLIRAE